MIDIDTGRDMNLGAISFVADWMLDECPDTYSDAQIVQAYIHHIIGDMARPKKIETVINHLIFNWRFIGAVGTENPDLFKEIWTAFYERVDGQ